MLTLKELDNVMVKLRHLTVGNSGFGVSGLGILVMDPDGVKYKTGEFSCDLSQDDDGIELHEVYVPPGIERRFFGASYPNFEKYEVIDPNLNEIIYNLVTKNKIRQK